MPFKIFAGVVAVLLLVSFVVPYVLKMKDIALAVVIMIGVSMMAVDLWQSLKSKED